MKGGASNGSVASSNKTTSSKHSQFGAATDGRKIRATVTSIKRKVKMFKKKHLGAKSKNINQSECVSCLEQDILSQWNLEPNKLSTYEEFLRLTLRKPLDESTVASDSFIDLLGLSEKAQDFETVIMNELKLKVSILLEAQVTKTFTSLKDEAYSSNLKCVSEYESKILQHKADIDKNLESFEKNLAHYEEISRPFLEYVRHGEEVTSVMGKSCNDLLKILKRIDSWLIEDEAYPGNLEEEMAQNASKKEEIMKRLAQVR